MKKINNMIKQKISKSKKIDSEPEVVLVPELPICFAIEALLMATKEPMSEDQLLACFDEDERPSLGKLRQAINALMADYADRAIELKRVASGYRFQIKAQFAPRISRLWAEKPAKYSRALLETLALIAYRQPITRGEIEDIRGVVVSTSIIDTLKEREWVKIVGHREVPGRPALYATTRDFLDYFNLKSLQELPPLPEIISLNEALISLEETKIEQPCHEQDEQTKTPETQPEDFALEADSDELCEEEVIV